MINTNYILYDLVYQGLCNNQRFIVAEKKKKNWHKMTAKKFIESVQAFALALHQSEIKKGDKVALHSENSINWLIADLAITAIGAITVPIYTSQSIEHIDYILKHAEIKMLVISNNRIAKAYKNISLPDHITLKLSFSEISLEGFKLYQDFMDLGNRILQENPDLFQELKVKVTPDDLVTITYTSGTTGTPKGVMLTHRNLVHAIQVPLQRTFLYKNFNQEQDTVLSFLPFTHVFEHCAIYGYLALSVPVYILDKLDDLVKILELVKPVHFTTVPRLLEKIYQNILKKFETETGIKGLFARYALKNTQCFKFNTKPSLFYKLYDLFVFAKIRQKLGGNLRGITTGGAALSSEIMQFFNAIGIPVGQGYGLTETSPGLTLYDYNHLKLNTVGKAFDDVELKIAEDGEILAKGPNIMQGYYKEPQMTAEVLTHDGWFHTGDVGFIDEDGFLYITDRKKELFKLSIGKYIAPSPIENKLISIIGVDQAMVVGENQKYCGVLIVPCPNFENETVCNNVQNALISINKTLSPWETIKKIVVSESPMSIESGELTPTFKKKRRVILEKRQADIAKLFI